MSFTLKWKNLWDEKNQIKEILEEEENAFD